MRGVCLPGSGGLVGIYVMEAIEYLWLSSAVLLRGRIAYYLVSVVTLSQGAVLISHCPSDRPRFFSLDPSSLSK